MTTSITAAQLDQLKRLGTATIHEAQGQRGAVDPRIAPLDPSMRLAGPALTVDIRPGDNLMIHYALTKARPGDVLVVDAKAFVDAGPWGDVLTFAAQQIGIAGLVIDGAVRDASQYRRDGLPGVLPGAQHPRHQQAPAGQAEPAADSGRGGGAAR